MSQHSQQSAPITPPGVYLKDIKIPLILILLANIGGYFHLLPVFIQVVVNSCTCVYVGSILTSKLVRSKDNGFVQEDGGSNEKVGTKEAMKFPIIASVFLIGFYLVYTYVSAELVNTLLTIQFGIAAILTLSGNIFHILPFPETWKKVIRHVKPFKAIKWLLEIEDFDISVASIVCIVLISIPVIAYCISKYWVLNNIFAILFAITALKSIDLQNFKVGYILLWFLFFYDIFWVYGTDIMVMVAKRLDLPIKILFPYINEEGIQKFSLLGLGDIVIPGIFVGLCLKYDVDKCVEKKVKNIVEFKLKYFWVAFFGYVGGICLTIFVLLVFEVPQPALLFIVPTCTIPVGLVAIVQHELDSVMKYTTSPVKKQQKQQEQDKDKDKSKDLKDKNK